MSANPRLTRIAPTPAKHSFANGNRASATINGVTTTASYTLDDQIINYGANSYAYDNDGYLESKATPEGTTTYTYNTLLVPIRPRWEYIREHKLPKPLHLNQFIYALIVSSRAILQ